METREIKLSIETATRWANGSDEELKALALETFPELAKKQLPKSWEELRVVKGFFLDSHSNICTIDSHFVAEPSNENVFFNKNQAKSCLAMAKLSQLMAVYNGDWVADWNNPNQTKWCIRYANYKLERTDFTTIKQFLAFKDRETAEEFFTNFKEDIEIYFNY